MSIPRITEILENSLSGDNLSVTTGLKALGNGVDTAIAVTSTEITVATGAEVVNIHNKSLTADMYPGITTAQRATGIKIGPGNTLLNYPVTGLSSFFLHSTIASETAGTQFYGRS